MIHFSLLYAIRICEYRYSHICSNFRPWQWKTDYSFSRIFDSFVYIK